MWTADTDHEESLRSAAVASGLGDQGWGKTWQQWPAWRWLPGTPRNWWQNVAAEGDRLVASFADLWPLAVPVIDTNLRPTPQAHVRPDRAWVAVAWFDLLLNHPSATATEWTSIVAAQCGGLSPSAVTVGLSPSAVTVGITVTLGWPSMESASSARGSLSPRSQRTQPPRRLPEGRPALNVVAVLKVEPDPCVEKVVVHTNTLQTVASHSSTARRPAASPALANACPVHVPPVPKRAPVVDWSVADHVQDPAGARPHD
jgi:hypothetical protein